MQILNIFGTREGSQFELQNLSNFWIIGKCLYTELGPTRCYSARTAVAFPRVLCCQVISLARLIWNSELQGGSLHMCRLRPTLVRFEWTSFELCTSVYEIFYGPTNLLASWVTELDDNLPYLMGVKRDSAWATNDVSVEAYTRVRWAWLHSLIVVMNCCHSWCLRGPRVSCCQVISLVRLAIDLNFCDTLENGWYLFTESKRRIMNFIILWW
jgi:hypothetical protein